MKMSALLVSVVLIVIIFLLYVKYKQTYWLRRKIPHEQPIFFIGNGSLKQHFSKVLNAVYQKYKGTGPFVGYYLFLAKAVVLLDLQLIKNVLVKDFSNFEDRGFFSNTRDDPLTGNLFFLDGEKWRQLRQKLSPTFTSGKMKYIFTTVVKVGAEFEAVMLEQVQGTQKTLEVIDLLRRFTADIIGKCAFGLECNSLRNPKAEFVTMGNRFFTAPRHNKIVEGLIFSFAGLARALHMCVINQSVTDFYMLIVRETIKYRESNGIKCNDFMDLLLDLKNMEDGLSVEEIAAQAFVFFIAGYETSALTMGFALLELAQHQEVQNKARQEIRKYFELHDNKITYECMQELVYLDQIISETLRKHPIVPVLLRKTRNRYETANADYFIEPSTIVMIPVSAIHHDPAYYAEPKKFDPARFEQTAMVQRPQFSYLPFGDGPRNCIGMRFAKMQSIVGLVYLLNNFCFSVAPETEIEFELNQNSFTLAPKNGIYLRVEKV